jgi:hypothetical protein
MRRTVRRRLYGKPTCFEGLLDGAQREARTFLSGGADERRCPLMVTPEPTFWTNIEFPWQSIPSQGQLSRTNQTHSTLPRPHGTPSVRLCPCLPRVARG